MSLSLDLELSDKPTEIQDQESLTIEISHSIVQTMSGKTIIAHCLYYCLLFILLLLSLFTQIPNGKKYTIFILCNIH